MEVFEEVWCLPHFLPGTEFGSFGSGRGEEHFQIANLSA